MIKLLHGDDDFLVDEELRTIRSQLEQKYEGLEIQKFDTAEASLGELATLISQPMLMAGTRLLVIYGASLLDNKEFDLDLLSEKRDVNTSLVLLEYSLLPKSNPVVRKLDASEVKSFPRLVRVREQKDWVVKRVSQLGGTIQPGAVQKLVELVGGNTRQLDSEINKLLLYNDDANISVEAVDAIVPAYSTERVFYLVDAVMDGDSAKGLRILNTLLQDGESPISLLALLSNETRRQIQAVHCLSVNMVSTDIKEKLQIRHDFILEKLMRRSRSLSMRQASGMHQLVYDTEIKIKRGEMRDRTALELLVVKMSSVRSGIG